jgi:hypothetical protein
MGSNEAEISTSERVEVGLHVATMCEAARAHAGCAQARRGWARGEDSQCRNVQDQIHNLNAKGTLPTGQVPREGHTHFAIGLETGAWLPKQLGFGEQFTGGRPGHCQQHRKTV